MIKTKKVFILHIYSYSLFIFPIVIDLQQQISQYSSVSDRSPQHRHRKTDSEITEEESDEEEEDPTTTISGTSTRTQRQTFKRLQSDFKQQAEELDAVKKEKEFIIIHYFIYLIFPY